MSRYTMCDVCGHRMTKIDEDTYYCKWCAAQKVEEDEDDESISVYDAADIWLSHGKDEDYMFGYSEEELEDAL